MQSEATRAVPLDRIRKCVEKALRQADCSQLSLSNIAPGCGVWIAYFNIEGTARALRKESVVFHVYIDSTDEEVTAEVSFYLQRALPVWLEEAEWKG